jgi:hypothetical protein
VISGSAHDLGPRVEDRAQPRLHLGRRWKRSADRHHPSPDQPRQHHAHPHRRAGGLEIGAEDVGEAKEAVLGDGVRAELRRGSTAAIEAVLTTWARSLSAVWLLRVVVR